MFALTFASGSLKLLSVTHFAGRSIRRKHTVERLQKVRLSNNARLLV